MIALHGENGIEMEAPESVNVRRKKANKFEVPAIEHLKSGRIVTTYPVSRMHYVDGFTPFPNVNVKQRGARTTKKSFNAPLSLQFTNSCPDNSRPKTSTCRRNAPAIATGNDWEKPFVRIFVKGINTGDQARKLGF